jgi:broad specificity phosphatase PhoE
MNASLFLVRHGEPRRHSDRIFLGQTDIPLSDRGRDEAAAAGDELARLQCRTDRIYSSDLLRACETAEIISARLTRMLHGDSTASAQSGGRDKSRPYIDALSDTPSFPSRRAPSNTRLFAPQERQNSNEISGRGGVPITYVPAFRELNMGEWDGELIEDIRRRFPDEYANRGEDILNYRVPGGENFHDLRERVTREFQRILRNEFFPELRAGGGSPDMVIVSHLGVIHTLIAELTHEDMNAVMRRRWPTGSVVQVEEFPVLAR